MIGIYSSVPYFYGVRKGRSNTVKFVIRMQDAVDGDALRQAVDTAMIRYPYLKLKRVDTRLRSYLQPNEAPITIVNSEAPVLLAGEEAGGHLIAFGYKDNNIFMYSFHGLFDGRGRVPFLKTLMYYYCTFRYGDEVIMEDVNLVGSHIDPAEYADPFVEGVPKGVRMKRILPPGNIMKLHKMGKVTPGAPHIHCIKIPEQAFISWCKSHDATPNTAVSLLMCKAVAQIHPDSKKRICAGVCCDLRTAMKAPKTHVSLVDYLHLLYDGDIRNKEFDTQCTVFRGQIMLQSDPDTLRQMMSVYKVLFSIISHLPSLRMKRFICRLLLDYIYSHHTFGVSYSGKVSYGSCNKHIRGFYAQPDASDCGIMIEITVADGFVLLDFMQAWPEDLYFNAFLDQLAAMGIEYKVAYSSISPTPEIDSFDPARHTETYNI